MHLIRTLLSLFASTCLLGAMLLVALAGPMAPATLRAGIRTREPLPILSMPIATPTPPPTLAVSADSDCCDARPLTKI